MTIERAAVEDITRARLEAQIRELATRYFSTERVDDLETWHLAQVVDHCSRAISDIYGMVNLDQILRGNLRRSRELGEILSGATPQPSGSMSEVTRAPDELKGIADRCLYDVGLVGMRDYHGLNLETLGVRSYRMAADILSILANERDLRELFQRNLMRALPIDEEVAFLRQCATRFNLYAQVLSNLREQGRSTLVSSASPNHLDRGPNAVRTEERDARPKPRSTKEPVRTEPRLGDASEPRDRLLSRYERILLFAGTDLDFVRSELKSRVIDQDDAVDTLCDDLLLNATGTQLAGVPRSYYLVGPTGVGKNFLLESLSKILQESWGVEIPFHIIEGPQYTYASDVHELRGATRGFIRSDEPGLLSEFHERSSRSPFSILVVDEVEKAHPQLQKFFLPILDRGIVHDNHGRELSFEGCLLAFTSNLGYSFTGRESEPIGYRLSDGNRSRRQEHFAKRRQRRELSPEFTARLKTIQFAPLSRESVEAILELQLVKVAERFRSLHGLEIRVTESARRLLLDLGFSEEHGARHLAATIERHCSIEVSRRIKKDQTRSNHLRVEMIEHLREIRKGNRAFDSGQVDRAVRDQARIWLPYRRLIIDASDGRFIYQGQEPV